MEQLANDIVVVRIQINAWREEGSWELQIRLQNVRDVFLSSCGSFAKLLETKFDGHHIETLVRSSVKYCIPRSSQSTHRIMTLTIALALTFLSLEDVRVQPFLGHNLWLAEIYIVLKITTDWRNGQKLFAQHVEDNIHLRF